MPTKIDNSILSQMVVEVSEPFAELFSKTFRGLLDSEEGERLLGALTPGGIEAYKAAAEINTYHNWYANSGWTTLYDPEIPGSRLTVSFPNYVPRVFVNAPCISFNEFPTVAALYKLRHQELVVKKEITNRARLGSTVEGFFARNPGLKERMPKCFERYAKDAEEKPVKRPKTERPAPELDDATKIAVAKLQFGG